jgi:predicted exporter
LIADLKSAPDIAMVRSGFTDDDLDAMRKFIDALAPTTFLPESEYTPTRMRARLASLRDHLAGPEGVMMRQTAPRDPLGGIWDVLDALRATRAGGLVDTDGILTTEDGLHAFVFLETKSSPFDSDAQRAFRGVLDRWRKAHPDAVVRTAGAAQYAIASEDQIKGDVNRIGILSTIGILAIFLVLFGSVRMILISFVPMTFGSAIAVLGTQAIFGQIHGITIAFGTSLLGVGLDYVEHYYAHFVLTPEVPAQTTMRHVGPSLALGAVTTIIGFIGLGASGLGGLRQMAVFAVIAIVASMAATYLMVPAWMPARYKPPRTLGLVDRGVLALLRGLTRHHWGRIARAAIVVIAAGSVALAVRNIAFSDNVNMLVDDSGAHVVEDRAVRALLGPDADAFAVVTASSDDALATEIASACAELERARTGQLVGSFVPLASLLPDRATQLRRHDVAVAAAPALREALAAEDFVADQFAPYWAALATPPKILTLADLRGSPLAPVAGAWFPAPHVALIPLTGIRALAPLQAAVPSATIVIPSQTIVEAFHGVRVRTVVSSLLGLVAIFALLFARYRSAKKVLIALAPALLACAATVGALVAMGTGLTILHVMSLLLVVSLGVDFGIFFVDTTDSLEEAARTMVSIFTASITTILSFGLLGLSHSPGLAALGITVTLGVTFSLLACLLLAALAGSKLVAGSKLEER